MQRLSLPFGHADVLYPEAGEERCTAELLVDVDPIGLVRRQGGAAGLTQYATTGRRRRRRCSASRC